MTVLHWDAPYALVQALIEHYPAVNVEEVGLRQLHALVVALPNFEDDPALAHDALLTSLLVTWYEEISG